MKLIDVTYTWAIEESLCVHKRIGRINQPYYGKLGTGLTKRAIGLMLSGLLFSLMIVLFVSSLKSPNTI
jgi:hypothetical protein